MPLTEEEILAFYEELILAFPFILIDNSEKGFTELQIKNMIPISFQVIPVRCVKRKKEILFLLVIHMLLEYRKLTEGWEIGDNGADEDLKRVVIGDVDTTFKGDKVNDDLFYKGSKYGLLARKMLIQCARSRVAVIV